MATKHPQVQPDREPPQDFDAEQAVLGSMLIEADAVPLALAIVGPEAFYRTYHKQICAVIATLHGRKEPVDLVTVSAELRRLGQLEEVGGGEYLTALVGEVPTAAHVQRYANIVAEKATLRNLAAAGAQIQALAYENPGDVGEALAASQRRIKTLQDRIRGNAIFSPEDTFERDIDESWEQWNRKANGISSARTGVAVVDERMGGLEAHRLTVFKAREKDGKTQFLRQAAITSARTFAQDGMGRKVLVCGLEENWDQWKKGAWSHVSGVDSKVLMVPGWLTRHLKAFPDDVVPLVAAQEELSRLPFRFCFGERNWMVLSAYIREEVSKRRVGLVVLDYFQLVQGGGWETYNEEHGYRMRANDMADLSKELQVPLLTASQVTWNRDMKRFVTKGAAAIQEAAYTMLEWEREEDAKHNKLDCGTLACRTTRLGTTFPAQTVRTDMRCGRFWDDNQYAQYQQAKRRGGGGGDNGDEEEDDGRTDPFGN